MEETIDIIERMESGNYEYDQMEAFEAWVKRHHGDKKEKEINNIKAQMADYESGPKYLHNYVSGEAALRNRILRLGEETKQGTEGGADKVQAYCKAIQEAAMVIKKQADWEIEPFDLGVAMRFRFILHWND